jgi:hypothetical protein
MLLIASLLLGQRRPQPKQTGGGRTGINQACCSSLFRSD